MKNPIKSMSGNMWAALRQARRLDCTFLSETACRTRRTTNALISRGLLERFNDSIGCYVITDLGRMVCDAFTEGQESVR